MDSSRAFAFGISLFLLLAFGFSLGVLLRQSEGGFGGLFLLGFLFNVIGVVPSIKHQFAIPKLNDAIGDTGDEIPIVRHKQCRSLVGA